MIDEQQLVLYYYEDGLTARERLQIRTALATDAELAQRYATLRAQLERLSVLPQPAAGAKTVQRWHDALESAARADFTKQRGSWMGWALAASVAVAVGLAATLMFRDAGPDSHPPTLVATAQPDPIIVPPVRPAFERALQAHFSDSRLTLAALPAATSKTRTDLIDGIVAQNRFHAITAHRRGDERLARVLRAFEPVLLRLADERTTADDVAAARAQLAFEFDAMLTKVSHDASNISKSF